LTLRALVPNAITSAALCSGLTGIRFAINGDFERAVMAVIIAGILDGIDGRVARMMKAQSRFGAELDSLSDAISFGVAPALILYLWSLQTEPRFGWFAALALAVCCALRLARFNARIDMADQPHKSAGFLTGVPAPVGAGLAMLPLYLWIASGREFRYPMFVGVWAALIAFLMISNMATLGWTALRPRRHPPGSDRAVRAGDCRAADGTVVDAGGYLRDLSGARAGGRGAPMRASGGCAAGRAIRRSAVRLIERTGARRRPHPPQARLPACPTRCDAVFPVRHAGTRLAQQAAHRTGLRLRSPQSHRWPEGRHRQKAARQEHQA
jgi:CDP-diacylglycerol--serine O-phosphatidyltransferase